MPNDLRVPQKTWLSVVLIVLAAISTQAAIAGYWIHETLLDTDDFMEVIEPVIRSDEFATSTGNVVSRRLAERLEVEERVTAALARIDTFVREELLELTGLDPDGPIVEILPDVPRLADLAPALTAAAEERVSEAVTDFTSSEGFRETMTEGLRVSHGAAVAILTEDQDALPDAVIVDGDVTLDLFPVMAEALVNLAARGAEFVGLEVGDIPEGEDAEQVVRGVFERRGVDIPAEFGQVVVLSADQLAPYRNALSTLNGLLWLLIILTLVLATGAILTNPDRVRGAVWLGVAVIIAALVNWPVPERITEQILSSIDSAGGVSLAGTVLTSASSSLQGVATLVILAALAVVIASLWYAWRQGQSEEGAPGSR